MILASEYFKIKANEISGFESEFGASLQALKSEVTHT